jgi:hypothetical protein
LEKEQYMQQSSIHCTPTHTFKVFIVSSDARGLTVQTMEVLALPPKEFCKMRVSLDSLKGM